MSDKNDSYSKVDRLSTSQRLGAAAVAACFLAAPALSNPVNPVVVNGTAAFNQAGNVLTVTNSNGAIINWDKFSIKAGETTRFAQPSASSSVLNRVLNDPTTIYGTLSSNGRVWLVNPAGILVGPGGRVDTAGFVASTLNISNENFLAGKRLFVNDANAKDVINQGSITTPSGGSVYLIGSNVTNEGLITTPQGETILAAGQTVSLIDSATPGVKVDITGSEGNATNIGNIAAEAGRIGIAGVIVRNSGNLNASSVVNEGGRIFLKASQDAYVDKDGRIAATGTKGGSVEVLGNRVAVMDNANIDASGANGGGTILVGGDYQGKNPEVQNSVITYFGPNASLKADATDNGNGGKVIVWADDTTRAYGSIYARGGVNGGEGGFIETSGHRYLDVAGIQVNAAAPNGASGHWLLDPNDIKIVHGSSDSQISGTTTFAPTQLSGDVSVSQLSDNTINTAINGGTSVTIQTASSGNGTGDIIFDGTTLPIAINHTAAAATTLALNATNNIQFKGTTTFETTGSSTGLTVVMNPGASGKVTSYAADSAVVNLSGVAGGHMEVQLNGGGKTWENDGTVGLSGNSTIRIYDSGSTPYSTFWNKTNGTVNLNSTFGWSFLSNSGTQNGVITNDCTINVNAPTSWEARYSQGAGGILNVYSPLSMQHLDTAAGIVNLYSAPLSLLEPHAGANTFSGATINGPGTLQIGLGAGGSLTTLVFNNVSTTGGLKVLREQFGGLTFSGTNSFADTSFFANDTNNTNMHWTIPVATFTGTTQWWAKGNIGFAGNTTFSGPVTLGAGWNVNIATPDVLPANPGNITISDRQIAGAGVMNMLSSGNIAINAAALPTTAVTSTGAMLVKAGGVLSLQGSNYGNARLESSDTQTIYAGSLTLTGASLGSGNYAQIRSGSDQTFTLTGGITMTGGGGTGFNDYALIAAGTSNSAATQTFNFIGTSPHTVSLSGGSSSGTGGFTDTACSTACAGYSANSGAWINNKGNGAQTFDFQAGSTNSITLTGGTLGGGNDASIDTQLGQQWIGSTAGSGSYPAIVLNGGASGGTAIKSGGVDYYMDNSANLGSNGSQIIQAASLTMAGNGGSAGSYSGAFMGSPNSDITVTGTLSANATGSAPASHNGSDGITLAESFVHLAPVAIGYKSANLLTIHAGSVSLGASTANTLDGGSSVLTGSLYGTTTTSITTTGGIVVGSSTVAPPYGSNVLIGSRAFAGGTVTLAGGTGNVALAAAYVGAGSGGSDSILISTSGSTSSISQVATGKIAANTVTINAGSGSVAQPAAAAIVASILNTSATGSGALSFLGANQVNTLSATATSSITFRNGSTPLAIGTSGVTTTVGNIDISTLDQPMTLNGVVNDQAAAGSVTLTTNGTSGAASITGTGIVTGNTINLQPTSLGAIGTSAVAPLFTSMLGTGPTSFVIGSGQPSAVYISHSGDANLTVTLGASAPFSFVSSGNLSSGNIDTIGGVLTLKSTTGTLTTSGALSGANISLISAVGDINAAITATSSVAAQAAGNITLTSGTTMPIGAISAPGVVSLTTTAGDITDTSGAVISGGSSIQLAASGNIGASGAPVKIITPTVTAQATSGGIWIEGHSAATPLALAVTATAPGSTTPIGTIDIANWGALTVVGTVSAVGNIALTAHSPLTINAPVSSSTGSITLNAGGPNWVAGKTGDDLIINAQLTASSGTITLNAGNTITIGASYPPSGTGVTTTSNLNPPAVPPPPTIADCTANPSLSGCSSVLPTLATCTTAPTTAGCTAVLPPLATCTTTPSAAGCSAVLPPLATCTTAPTTAGCSAVLPTLATCTSTPSAAGCTVVLPPLATCTTAPTTAGCSAVLPTLATCTSTPTAAGCTVVLPTLASCTTAPTTAGCSVVLPTVATCTTTPTAAGCSVVLPTLASCTTAPTTAGCTVVLPTLAACTSTPSSAGCSVVLPTLATCTSTPAAAGCTVVLPALASCISTPTAAGCSAVLPSIASCTATPGAAGCSVVLPSLTACTFTPAQAGCSAVLPTLATCTTTPTAAGCSVVLPTLASCTTNAGQEGCSVVLPQVSTTTVSTTTNQIVTLTETATSNPTKDTTTPTPPPAPTPVTTGSTGTLALLNTHQTTGGSQGTFGGDSTPILGGTSSSNTGTTSSTTSNRSTTSTSTSTTSSDTKTAATDSTSGSKKDEDKKDEKKDEKKSDAANDGKKDDKPAAKKTVAQCSS